jgi:hypothetical protein
MQAGRPTSADPPGPTWPGRVAVGGWCTGPPTDYAEPFVVKTSRFLPVPDAAEVSPPTDK